MVCRLSLPARRLLSLSSALIAGASSDPVVAQDATASAPAAVSEPIRSDETFDFGSAERLTGDWGGLRVRVVF